MNNLWSQLAWTQASHIYQAILQLPFVRELAEGTLGPERFRFYMMQDALYLDNYSRVLAHIASRIPGKEHSEHFLRFALDGVMVEKALHESFIGKHSASPSPACTLYMDYLAAMASQPVEVAAAAVLPCFWVYQRVGEVIVKNCRPDNPYKRWIDTYADQSFAQATHRAIDICDALAAAASPEVRKQMTRAFEQATRMEWLFWDSAYNLEQWKI